MGRIIAGLSLDYDKGGYSRFDVFSALNVQRGVQMEPETISLVGLVEKSRLML